ncbi:MAG: DUF3856 domain-containing protein [Candidatus Hydrogenedentes bacterium]|nr:DUF3856 domain-containing protein [Candidatus Hydrogenedentota bacterium]
MNDVIEALTLENEGKKAFDQGEFERSVQSFTRALGIADGQKTDENFDYPRFAAHCNAGLSGALGNLGRDKECLSAAQAALDFFDRCGAVLPGSFFYWVMAIMNKAVAQLNLGDAPQALEGFQRARSMMLEGGDSKTNQWIKIADQGISEAREKLQPHSSTSKRWWEVWK